MITYVSNSAELYPVIPRYLHYYYPPLHSSLLGRERMKEKNLKAKEGRKEDRRVRGLNGEKALPMSVGPVGSYLRRRGLRMLLQGTVGLRVWVGVRG